VTDHLIRALAPVLHDLDAACAPRPAVEPSDWQDRPTAESALLRAGDGSSTGLWVDTARSPAEQVVMVAGQVQDWAIEEMARRQRPTGWPPCDEHPGSHPLEPALHFGAVAAWVCPRSRRPACEIGRLSGAGATSMSVVPVDERDCSWERHLPRLRVYFQRSIHGSTGGSTSTYDVTGADVLQVIDWAQRRAGADATYSIALVVDAEEGRGLVWLVGTDGNDTADPPDPEWTVQQRMLTRVRERIGIPPADRATR
jgi:hypothetical protein